MPCRSCSAPLSKANTSGYCKRHVSAAMASDPAWREKQKAGVRKAMADPVRLQAMREVARRNGKAPGATEKRSDAARRIRLWERGHDALAGNTEALARRGRSRSSTVLAHIPRECRDDYRLLVRRKCFTAAEATAIVLAQHEADMNRFRREIGA